MISKKDAVTLGMLAIGGVGAAMIVGGGSGDGGGAAMEGVKGRAGGILGSQEGYGTTVYNLPAQPSVTFPEAPKFDISKFLEPMAKPAVGRGAAGISAAPKKYRSAGSALGYPGYVTPTTPTPVSPGYIPGVTTFKKYEEPVYIPSPVKPPSVSYGGGGGGSSSKKSSASKAVSHAKRLRAGRGD